MEAWKHSRRRWGGGAHLCSLAVGERDVLLASRPRPKGGPTLGDPPIHKKGRRRVVLGYFPSLPLFTRHFSRIRHFIAASIYDR